MQGHVGRHGLDEHINPFIRNEPPNKDDLPLFRPRGSIERGIDPGVDDMNGRETVTRQLRRILRD